MAPNNVSKEQLENPNKNLSIPDWIQPAYFQGILEKDYPNFKSILSFTPVAATSPGENYVSIMVRVHIELLLQDDTTEKLSYILKTSLVGLEVNKLLSNMNPFQKERELYESLIPKFEKFYAEAGKTVKFAPECKLFEKCDDRETLVLEDLKQKNFKNIDRFSGFDLKHMKKVLKKLAEFHAVSAVYHERFGPYSKLFNRAFYVPENREYIVKVAETKRKLFLSAMEKWGGCEKYIKLWPQAKAAMNWFEKYDVPNPDEINVLNHGDCWSNNIMLQYDENGEIQETYLIDFQMCKWGSPTQDLCYLITTSAGYDIRLKEFDRFLRIYQEHLAENLQLLKYSKPIPSLKEIHIFMFKYSPWEYFTATTILPMTSLDADENVNIDNAINDIEFRKKSLMTPRYIKTMKQLLPWWENRGTFQINS